VAQLVQTVFTEHTEHPVKIELQEMQVLFGPFPDNTFPVEQSVHILELMQARHPNLILQS
jgi:hypothetical protein